MSADKNKSTAKNVCILFLTLSADIDVHRRFQNPSPNNPK